MTDVDVNITSTDLASSESAVFWPSFSISERVALEFLAGYSGATRCAYAQDLTDWFAFCRIHNVDVMTAHRSHVDLYKVDLAEARGLSASTVARRLSALSGYYERAVEEEVLTRSPVTHVRRPRVSDESVSTGLDRSELRSLIDSAREHGSRSYAFVCLLALNGLRVSEACDAQVEHLAIERGHHVLHVIRKGGKRARLAIPPITVEAVNLLVGDRESGPIFATKTGKALDRVAAGRTIKRLAIKAGIARNIHAHDLRHAFVTLSLEAGVSLRDVQDGAGHADPRTTRRYDRARFALDRSASYTLATFVAM